MLVALRSQLARAGLAAYVVPTADPHQSEYVAERFKRRAALSGFTGSAGTAVVTADRALLWTDGRYFLQAEKQLSAEWTLMRSGMAEVPTVETWLKTNLDETAVVGIDPFVISIDGQKTLAACQRTLAYPEHNLVDLVWSDMPAMPTDKVFVLPDKYTGQSAASKLSDLRASMQKHSVGAFVVSALDQIAWLLNLRGSDVEFNPVFHAYCLVTPADATLYVDERKLQPPELQHLSDIGVRVLPYETPGPVSRPSVIDSLAELAASAQTVWMDTRASFALYRCLPAERVLLARSPIEMAKAKKNAVELQGMRDCHIRDGAALLSFLAWLEERARAGDRTITEYSAAEELERFRRQQALFFSLSFDSISATGPNAAIIHYKPEPATAAVIDFNNLYLIDSGGQYWDGTTDVTRTVHLGTNDVSEEVRRAYTLVLKGYLQLAMAVFPAGTTGYQLDLLARTPLWTAALDYRHGTGHGVGSFLNVHEGPHGISSHVHSNAVALEVGMTTSDEPGFYKDGEFGIRIESILAVQPFQSGFGGKEFMHFENLTVCPIQTKLVLKSLLSAEEVRVLNAYNHYCASTLAPLVAPSVQAYLARETEPI